MGNTKQTVREEAAQQGSAEAHRIREALQDASLEPAQGTDWGDKRERTRQDQLSEIGYVAVDDYDFEGDMPAPFERSRPARMTLLFVVAAIIGGTGWLWIFLSEAFSTLHAATLSSQPADAGTMIYLLSVFSGILATLILTAVVGGIVYYTYMHQRHQPKITRDMVLASAGPDPWSRGSEEIRGS